MGTDSASLRDRLGLGVDGLGCSGRLGLDRFFLDRLGFDGLELRLDGLGIGFDRLGSGSDGLGVDRLGIGLDGLRLGSDRLGLRRRLSRIVDRVRELHLVVSVTGTASSSASTAGSESVRRLFELALVGSGGGLGLVQFAGPHQFPSTSNTNLVNRESSPNTYAVRTVTVTSTTIE